MVKPQPTSVSSKAHKEHGAAAGHTTWNQRAKVNVVNSYLSAFRDMLVMEVQEAKSRCLSLEQNLLRLVHVLKENTRETDVTDVFKAIGISYDTHCITCCMHKPGLPLKKGS